MKGVKACELCSKEAAVYCDADHAFLCWTCDGEVHQANFLVARHLRQPLCSSCKRFSGEALSGADLRRSLASLRCRSCSPEEVSIEASSSDQSSVCLSSSESKLRAPENRRKVSSKVCCSSSVTEISDEASSEKTTATECNESETEKKVKTRNDHKGHRAATSVDAKAEGIFGNWCRELGLNGNSAIVAVSAASDALRLCVGRPGSKVFPFRVSLTASFWCGLRSIALGDKKSSARELHALERLAEVSGVPAKLILAVGSKIDRELRVRRSRRRDLAEGWAECSG